MYQIKEIKGFPGYRIDTNGDVYGKRNKKLKPYCNKGYLGIILWKNKQGYYRQIHRLMLETFISECPYGMESCHNNGKKSDNRLKNLRWDTKSANQLDRHKHGVPWFNGEERYNAKLTDKKVRVIKWALYFGAKQHALAKFFRIAQSSISQIKNQKIWKHVSINTT